MQHTYQTNIKWQNSAPLKPFTYTSYTRNHTLHINGKADLLCSSDVIFRGDGNRYNPEDFLLASVSSCHMLWYLHLCADNGITVIDYSDTATGVLQTGDNQPGKFVAITLHPHVTIADAAHIQLAHDLHHKANKHCFIANTLNLEIAHVVTINVLTK